MPLFKIRLYHGVDKPAVHYQDIIADHAQQAAEKACGERVNEQGTNGTLRAVVILPDGHKRSFYKLT
jgi:hypothetical protein